MLKGKNYDWKDSNIALFGSSQDRKVKKESAATEPAWNGVGNKLGLKIWRIVNFKVVDWPVEDYGKFYDGDSFIVLHTFKKQGSDEILFDLHFWIGQHSTQDEYGTAAYKTVELDTFLDDKPVQHREVQGYESELFNSYFPSIEILKGGAESGFRHVAPESYSPRLLQFVGDRKNVQLIEVALSTRSINNDDVFIYDIGLKAIQLNGPNANKDERYKASQYLNQLKSDRKGRLEIEVLDTNAASVASLGLGNGAPDVHEKYTNQPLEFLQVSDASGSLSIKKVNKQAVQTNDVFIIAGNHVYVWVGRGASVDEKRNALGYAHNYLKDTSAPLRPVTVVNEGREPQALVAILA